MKNINFLKEISNKKSSVQKQITFILAQNLKNTHIYLSRNSLFSYHKLLISEVNLEDYTAFKNEIIFKDTNKPLQNCLNAEQYSRNFDEFILLKE